MTAFDAMTMKEIGGLNKAVVELIGVNKDYDGQRALCKHARGLEPICTRFGTEFNSRF